MFLIKNARIIIEGNETAMRSVLIDEGRIKEISEQICITSQTDVLDAGGKLLLPGFIDAHTHLREPGFEEKETILTGTQAAARGGFTTVMPMANVRPVPDSPEEMKKYVELLNAKGVVRIAPYASVTKGQGGRRVVKMDELLDCGAAAFSDDGVGIQDDAVMLSAMKQAASLGAVIAVHAEAEEYKNHGVVHDGDYAKSKGWPGISSACEYSQVDRDLEIVRITGCKYHVCHVSAAETVGLIKKAKWECLPVTAEVTPHHLILCDEDVKGTNEKMNPPLRSERDRLSLWQGLKDGTIDIIATDHAPHTEADKEKSMEEAPFGVVGLETAFPLLYTQLVRTGKITLEKLSEAMSTRPAEIFGFKDRGRLQVGYKADLVFIDMDRINKVNPSQFKSKGKNTPFAGWKLKGWPVMTMVGGEIVYGKKRWEEEENDEDY